jgi:hypothetical protein
MGHNGKEAMNYEETILVSLNLSSSWQSIRPSYPKISIYITHCSLTPFPKVPELFHGMPSFWIVLMELSQGIPHCVAGIVTVLSPQLSQFWIIFINNVLKSSEGKTFNQSLTTTLRK